jgi:hypothetical protein
MAKPYLRTRVHGNTEDNPRATEPGQVWEHLKDKLGQQAFGKLVDDMNRMARRRKGR